MDAVPEKMAGGTLALPGEKEEMPVPHILKDGDKLRARVCNKCEGRTDDTATQWQVKAHSFDISA